MNKNLKTSFVLLALINSAFAEQSGFWTGLFSKNPPPVTTSEKIVPTNRQEISFSFAPIVKKVKGAVVSINAVQVNERQQHPFFDEDFFRFFFGGLPRQQLEKSLGSGVIVDPKGVILTCNHVVQNSRIIQVQLEDGREFKATIILSDPKNDLAAIQIQGSNQDFPYIPLSDSREEEVGDLVLAIGNPFGVGQTVTNGIISATVRRFGPHILMQTDAPINPGNSGGALINMQGHLVGIPNAILSKTGASHGIGFAIPVATIKPALIAAVTGKPLALGWDGVEVKSMTAAQAESFGMASPSGVLVASLHEASPALAAGLKTSDIIVAIDEDPIRSVEDFALKLRNYSPGQQVKLQIRRLGEIKEIVFKLIAPPEIPAADETVLMGAHPLSGAKVANISPAIALKYDLGNSLKGVVIVDTPPRRGRYFSFNVGDTIEQVNGQKVGSVKELVALLNGGRVVSLRLNQNGNMIEIRLQ